MGCFTLFQFGKALDAESVTSETGFNIPSAGGLEAGAIRSGPSECPDDGAVPTVDVAGS